MNLRDQLQTIYKANGQLTPRLVVDLARDEAHPLHDRFEWDNEIAGEKYREHQAGELIRSVKVRYTTAGDDERDVRAFHAIPSNGEPTGYRPIEEIVSNDIGRQLLLNAARREWKTFERKYSHLEEFADIVRGQGFEASA